MARRNLHRLLFVCALLGATLVSIEALAEAPPRLVNYQGRLKDAVGDPVPDGSYLMRFSVWDDSTGGMELWSETQSVTAEDGLFTTDLGKTAGFFDICAPCDVWLQTQVQSQGSFTTLLPRQRLTPTPFALVAGGVTGESNPSGPGTPQAIGTVTGSGGATVDRKFEMTLEADTDGDGQYEYELNGKASTETGASHVMTADLDADGNPDRFVAMGCDDSTSSLEVANIGSSGQDGVRIDVGASGTDLRVVHLNGLPPGEPVLGSLSMHAEHSLSSIALGDMDGSDDNGMEMKSTPSGPFSTLSTHHGSTTGTIRMATTSGGGPILPSSEMYMDMDSDDDGVPESSSSRTCDAIETRDILKGRSGSTTGTIRMQAAPDSGVDEIVFDDGAGTEMKVKEKASRTKCSSNLRQLGPASTHEIEHSCDSAGARGVLTGMSGSTTGTIRMEATSTGVISSEEMDQDNDGKAESKHRRMINADAKLKAIFARDSNDDGTDDMSFETSVDDDSATLRLNGLPPGTPVEGDYTMSASGSGARGVLSGMSGSTTGTIRMVATSDGSEIGIDRDDDNDGVADRSVSMDCDDTEARLNIGSSGQDGVSIVSDASGSRMAVDTIPGTHPITVGGGAYCDGANWVNASDVNSKENFNAVNGKELLEKIEDLPITQWNYKQDEADVKHIGPTAQDFKSAFGVGADDKSISTIDPSGIALAAIQQLIKENAELRARIVKLEEGQTKSHAR